MRSEKEKTTQATKPAKAPENRAENRAESLTTAFTSIAERLAARYDMIYYIDVRTSRYAELSTRKKSGELKVKAEGDDFFTAAWENADRLICAEDRDRVRLFLDRERLLNQLENRKQAVEDYRMILPDGSLQHTRMTATYSSDRSHIIFCIENREEDVRREREQLAALSLANELARRDELTHTKNTTAYHETEKELQRLIAEHGGAFGMVVCDINELKVINDTEGHRAGDDYIRAACLMICRVFHHSPVYRIGGDEFAVVLRGQDYDNREYLLASLKRQAEKNLRIGEGAVLACGMAEYEPETDRTVRDVFNRADSRMYAHKTHMKELKLRQEARTLKEREEILPITEERRMKLDTLYKAFEVVSEGTYVYLCDMKYDFSRWSKAAVDLYGLPAEYMYGAGDIWETHIHPEDRDAYHRGIADIFAGNAAAHDVQYRARRLTGEYDVCTCRGVVIRDVTGEPDYFAGTIRNHGVMGHIDSLTGLRNQYGFFEDLDVYLKRNTEVSVVLLGISRFSEINEMYGYQFGNRVLQRFGRNLFDTVGNTGHTYRIDGTKFAVISSTLTVAEIGGKYDAFRTYLHENFQAEGRAMLLNLQCGALRVENCDIDIRTVYSCLNFAYEESKTRRRGELVEFRSDLTEDSQHRLEQLHEIRASVVRGFEGFYLMYQPVVDAKTERMIGAEALLRWTGPGSRTVPPDDFIPVLEADPIFPELGEWILREALRAVRPMLESMPDFVINVNLSYTQMDKPDFADSVLSILEEEKYPPENLCLEVTERCRLLDMELLKNVIIKLKSSGIRMALDDFGTGFSSVGIMREIPFDTIKIDRSFAEKIGESEANRKVVQGITGLAASFGAEVCAEGIETREMRDILQHFSVRSFQGYYYSEPLPPEQIPGWRFRPQS